MNVKTFGIVGIATGVLSMGYTIFLHSKLNKVNDIINASIADVAKDINVDISETIIGKAVEKAVEREVHKAVRDISYKITDSVSKDIKNKVKAAVDESYSDVRKEVSKQVSKDVSNFDINLLRDQVKNEAKTVVLAKFNDSLDSLLQDFNQNLTNVSKIYGSIADNMVRKPQETIFKMSN